MAINKTINKSTKSRGAMRNCIEYVMRADKTERKLAEVIGPYEQESITYDGVYQAFLEEKRIWGKDSGRMYATTSFPGMRTRQSLRSRHWSSAWNCRPVL